MSPPNVKLKVMESVQDDVNKGIIKIDSGFLKQIGASPGDVIEIIGERTTAALVDRAYPGDIGLNIIRMDGNTRRNARTSIGELVTVQKAQPKPAKRVVIAPASKGIMIRASPQLFKQGLLGKALVKGDLVSLGRSRRRGYEQETEDIFSLMQGPFSGFAGFGFADLKFMVVDTQPKKEICIVTPETEIEFNPQAVEITEEDALGLGINYEDIGGLGEEIKNVREMIELPLKHPEIFEKLGIEPPKGVLLHGPPGTGKTLLAKAVASETNSHFILINGPEIISKFYGESEQNLRKKFEEAEKNAPSIIFFDEIDAIAAKREEVRGEVEKRVVAQLLSLMDGLKSRGKVIVIAATNMPNTLDPALRRPGRFDREIEIGVPRKEGRLEILKIHTRNMPLKGKLYGNILQKHIIKELENKSNQLGKEINQREEKIYEFEAEIIQKEKKIKEFEEKKKGVDESILLKIVEFVKRSSKEIESIKTEIKALTQNILVMKDEVKTVISLLEAFNNSKAKLLKVVEEIILVDEAQSKYSPFDPRYHVYENKRTDELKKIEELKLLDLIRQKSEIEGVPRDLEEIARITHGFVGADLNSLAKEAAMIVLRQDILPLLQLKKIEENEQIPKEVLEKLRVNQKDFIEALKVVRPSAMREVMVETPDVSWNDVGGLEDVKERLKEAVEWPLKRPEAFKRMGIRPPRGILLYGPPGTGKTLLAKAVAKESEANFILVNGPSLLSKWVGESEKALRQVFQKARQTAPTIIFFDEIDALVPRRQGDSGDSGVTERLVNQMLTEMDGLESLHDVVIIAATNRPDMVDPALLRQGRFDRIILTPVPDEASRKRIFDIYLKKMPLAADVDAAILAKKTQGYVGADVEGVCREAAMAALREDAKAKEVMLAHFLKALEIVHPSIDKEVEEAYAQLASYFSSARAKEITHDKEGYFG